MEGVIMLERWRSTVCFTVLILISAGQADVVAAERHRLFSDCVVVAPQQMGEVEEKALAVLQEEIEKRTGIRPERTSQWPEDAKLVIAIGLQSQVPQFAGPFADTLKMGSLGLPGADSFYLSVRSKPRPAAIIIGKDSRGLLYGVGHLLRKMQLSRGAVTVPESLNVLTAPKYPLRGHQLGYRPKTNAYDAWSVAQFDQYIRELALFGTNSIELIPPRSDDDALSPHMQPPMQMMIKLSEVIDSYGLDVWIWYPNVGDDYTSPQGIAEELAERDEVFKSLERIDAILVPGGDPGHLHPDVFFPWMDKVADVLHKYHPRAKIWVSPQAMSPTREWLDSFYKYVNQKPKWLEGVVFAPWVKTPLPEIRRIVDEGIKIRRYPDITHSVVCQYPVRNWDPAFALTLHRECFNPRPVAMKTIHNALDEYACGSLTYSEGINDDINKFIWGDQDWDPDKPVIETLQDYCRLFISPAHDEELAAGFMAQEKNWEGALIANAQVDLTLQQWQDLEESVSDAVRNNYRFQMGLLRAYYDAYIKRRLAYETDLERRARDILRSASEMGALQAIEEAERTLKKAREEPVAVAYRKKCEMLADLLSDNIGAQLTVEKHGASHRTRGAFMDGIDEPLNDVGWLLSQFGQIRDIKDESARLDAIRQVLDRTNPGPGGFYDNMGAPSSMRRIRTSVAWQEDPGTLRSPRIAFNYRINRPEDAYIPLAWKSHVGTIYETPLTLYYDNLDPETTYSVRVAYMGGWGNNVRLVADGQHVIHELIETREPPVREFPVPGEATSDGQLELTWTCGEGERGSEVSEIWLIPQKD
jgi:hypothetical protein